MTNPLDEQRAAHVRCLQDFAAAYDAESANGLALRAAIAALTNPLQFVEFASADALAAWLETLHETDGPAVTGNKFAPAQRAAAAIRAGDTLTAPPLCAKGEDLEWLRTDLKLIDIGLGFALCNFDHVGTRRDVVKAQEKIVEILSKLEDTTPAQPRREVTERDVERACIAALAGFADCIPSAQDALRREIRAALESFANGGDGNG